MVAGLEAIGQRLPFPIRGIDSDNDSVFINETLVRYCADHDIEFTRSRAYRSNDQAWIEQKNGSVVRRFVGYDRYSGQVAGQTMASPVRSVASVRELLPTLIQTDRQGPVRRRHHQAVQSAHPALRPVDPARCN